MANICPRCDTVFTRRDSLQRHIKRCWAEGPSLECEHADNEDVFVFKHPFCMVVSGPTSCGKTFWTKQLLQEKSIKITPHPDRIIWLYKRWQPLYDELRILVPDIEFIKGIPLNIDKDEFLDTKQNNLIIIDDLMASSF